MAPAIDIITHTRRTLLTLIGGLTIDQLNEIPDGFNNNIAWNVAHLIATQQRLCYSRCDLQPRIADSFIAKYQKGTKPESFITDAEFTEIRELLFTSLEILKADYDQQVFANYTAWTTPYGNDVSSVDDALNFLPFHEGLHYGYVMALKRMILNK